MLHARAQPSVIDLPILRLLSQRVVYDALVERDLFLRFRNYPITGRACPTSAQASMARKGRHSEYAQMPSHAVTA